MQPSGGSYVVIGQNAKKLVTAVSLAARGKGEPPPELTLAWFCGDHHLPDSGGIMDQDYATMSQMRASSNIYRVVKKFYTLTGEDSVKGFSPDERELLAWLDKMELLPGLNG